MSAETSPISDISGAATNSAAAPKKPQQAKRIDVTSAPASAEPKRPASKEAEAAWPSMPQMDVAKFFEEGRERLKEAFEQANGRFDNMRGAARDAGNVCQESQVACLSGLKDINEHIFDLVQSEIDRSYDFMRSASEVKGVSELVQLQADYLRDTMETQAEQAKAFSELTTTLFKSTFGPLQQGFATVFENARKRS
ncbi:MAG: phasin family protein [Alphaproteobacteria bacterium]